MAWIEIMPRFQSLFSAFQSAEQFLNWTGILINCHRHRQVERACPALTQGETEGCSFILKKESRVTWHQRFLNAWHGFGWCSTSVREAAILLSARASGIGCPDVVAFGEDSRSAFVLTRDETHMLELRVVLQTQPAAADRIALAQALGRELANLHNAGFRHPDLFAKHILVAPAGDLRFCFLDWARAERRNAVSWQSRLRDLAALDATLHASLASDRVRMCCLRAYVDATGMQGIMPLRRAALQVRRAAERLARKRSIRELRQLASPQGDFEFFPIAERELLVVRSFWEEVGGRLPQWLLDLPAGKCAPAKEHIRIQHGPRPGRRWEMPTLAHTLFRLRRFGLAAPRLLAVGASATGVFVVTRVQSGEAWQDAFDAATSESQQRMQAQAENIMHQLDEAGYRFPDEAAWSPHFQVCNETGEVVLADADTLQRCDTVQRKRPIAA